MAVSGERQRREKPAEDRTADGRAPAGVDWRNWRTGAAVVAGLAMLFLLSKLSRLLFHSVAEVLGVICAGGVFVTVWHGRRDIRNAAILVLGTSALFVGIFDLLHMHYSYRGAATVPLSGQDLPGRIRIAGRYVQGLSFLVAAFMARRRVQAGPVFAASATAAAAVLSSVFLWCVFFFPAPAGDGFALFSGISEIAVICLFAASLALLARSRGALGAGVFEPLAASLFAVIGAEVLFLFSRNDLDLRNFLGHVLQVFSYFLLYRAVIAAAITGPRSDLVGRLERSEAALSGETNLLETYLDTAGIIIVVLNADQSVGLINKAGERVLGYSRGELRCRNWFDVVIPARNRDAGKRAFERILGEAEAPEREVELEVVTRTGERRTIVWHTAVLKDRNGSAIALLGSGEDVTDRRRAETDQDLLIQDLRTALNRVKTLSGLLPICAACKKVRDDRGYWKQVETYVEEHSNAHFTHGLCPDCAQRLYPELFKDGMPPE